MAQTVEVLLVGPPSPTDPLGRRWELPELSAQNPGPVWVVAEVVAQNQDGTLDVQIGDAAHGGRTITASEGDRVGQFRRVAGIRHGDLRAIRQALAPLLQDPDAAVRTATETVAALFGRGDRRSVAQTLVGVAANTNQKSAQRVQALTLLGVLLAQEIDR